MADAAVDAQSRAVDPWRLTQRALDAAHAARDESLFALANGTLGVRGGFEESPSATQGSFLAGAWERSPIHYHEKFAGFARATDTRVPVADGTSIRVRLGDEAFDTATGIVLAFERALDLARGRLERVVRWRSPRGATVELRALRVVPIDADALLCIRLELHSVDYAGPVTFDSALSGEREAPPQGDDPRIGAGADAGFAFAVLANDEARARVAQHAHRSGIAVVAEQRHVPGHGVAFERAYAGAASAHQVYAGTLAPGASLVIEKFVAYACSAFERPEPVDALATRALATLAAAGSFDAQASAQEAAFAAFWRDADIAIDGDAASEQALRFNLFHVFQSAGRHGRGSIAAKGLTGEGYEGHVFWDAETFVLPALAFTAPHLARSLLEFRHATLAGARAHAREMNHARGALYPWRTIGGDECSAHYPSGSAQYHINAAIAYAIRLYLDATDDTAFLADAGAEILFETARIWLDVGHFNPRRGGAFCIHEVTGPDEYSALADNNWYTNLMAREHLRHAASVACLLAEERPDVYAGLAARIALDADEPAQWRRAAEAMYLPYDERLAIHAQDDGFLDKPRWPASATQRPLLLHHHPMTIFRHQVCKQADVLLGLVLAGDGVDRATKRRDFDYYEGVTVHDSTLSASTFAIVAAQVGHADKAWRYFNDTLRVDLDDLHGNASHGAHMAAMAGSWLALAWGYAGLRVVGGSLAFEPALPDAWRGYRVGLVWKGRRIGVDVARDAVRYRLVDGEPLAFSHMGASRTLRVGADVEAGRFPQPFKALVFDLDGVIADTAVLHHAAWKRLAGEIGLSFDETIGERLKGVDRMGSLEIVLGDASARYTHDEKHALAERKNGYYVAAIAQLGPENLLPGAREALVAARAAGLKIALASASRSAGALVERFGLADFFDHVVDAASIARPKPDPEIFLAAARALGVAPGDCLGIEDAVAGVDAIRAAGMRALGVGDGAVLAHADAVIGGLTEFDVARFVAMSGS
ncbi:beta-phosphoglucomutase [Tahibacter soli]|uniref:Beta-phosphoglucomutase n=1 Tax=Tahibacter soli TaxID=2983605 RepID=A0A9X3YPF2_9GAMM|nr:beta-phosphoglucomutase [Tahibacter soli]MDC8016042.1 beta-phosphoglucomutase [Tahibacter soli]